MGVNLVKYLFLPLLLILVATSTTPAIAVTPSSVNMTISPPNPAPNENVNIALSSFAANLDTVNITWFVNGTSSLSGIGQKSFSVNAPDSGQSTKVVAKIAFPDGEVEKTAILSPAVTVLLWQATDSYVPPFYKGKALLPAESSVKVVAIPEIKTGNVTANPRNMTYSWKKNFTNMAGSSGYGKSSFSFTTDYLEDVNNVGVVASTLDQSSSSEANINIPTAPSQVSLYKYDNSMGILWERALSANHRMTGEETVVAIPYFFSPKELLRPEVAFRWFINDFMVNNSGVEKNIMPLRAETGTSGISKLKVEIENTDSLNQKVSKEINVEF